MRVRKRGKRRWRRRGEGGGEDPRLLSGRVGITLDAASAAAVCNVGTSAGQGGRGINVLVVGDVATVSSAASLGEEEEKKEKEKDGAADPRSIVTTPSVCDNWGVDDGQLKNSGLFMFSSLYLIGP